MKRAKQLTKRERKALAPQRPVVAPTDKHIHCIACGKHLDPVEFQPPATATMLECQHKSRFPSCVDCADLGRRLLIEHDRSGRPVQTAAAWH